MIANVLSVRGIGWALLALGCLLLALGVWLKAGDES